MQKALLLVLSLLISGCPAYSAEQQSLANETPQITTPTIKLPDDLTQWQDFVVEQLRPALASEDVVVELRKLLDFTMPKTGNFDPINVERRQSQIQLTYNMLVGKPEGEQVTLIQDMLVRHKQYLHFKK